LFLQEKLNSKDNMIPFAYILVRNSDETKFFTNNDSWNYRNPLPGTIVDSEITEPYM